MRLNKISLAALALGASMLLSACGGGNDSPLRPVTTATADTTVQISKDFLASSEAAVQAVLGQTFSFPNGVWGATGSTTLTLTGDKAAPDFSLTVAGQTIPVTGKMSYGACIFTITGTPFTVGPFQKTNPPAVPPITISACSLTAGTAGHMADGSSTPSSVTFTLNGTSGSVTLPVSISSTGVVTVNGFPFGTVTVVATTGAGT